MVIKVSMRAEKGHRFELVDADVKKKTLGMRNQGKGTRKD